jgi:hypothetical protein
MRDTRGNGLHHANMDVRVEDAAIVATPPFHRLVPATAGYRTAPIMQGFNWSYTLEDVEWGRWYLIVFRSKRRADADRDLLSRHDDLAFAEALMSGGLLRYYKGALDREQRCLSLCVWDRRRSAEVATRMRDHRAAARLTGRFYHWYDVERYVLRKRKGYAEPDAVQVGAYGHPPSHGAGRVLTQT